MLSLYLTGLLFFVLVLGVIDYNDDILGKDDGAIYGFIFLIVLWPLFFILILLAMLFGIGQAIGEYMNRDK